MCLSGRAEAQFSMLIPSSSTVMEDKEYSLKLDVFYAYPMEMRGLDMQQPKSLTITRDGKVENIQGDAQAGYHHRASGLAGCL